MDDAKKKNPKPTTKIPPEGEAGRGMGAVNQIVSGGKKKKGNVKLPHKPSRGSYLPPPSVSPRGGRDADLVPRHRDGLR